MSEKWREPIHKEVKTETGYHLICYVSDPYYYVEVYDRSNKIIEKTLLANNKTFDKIVERYKNIGNEDNSTQKIISECVDLFRSIDRHFSEISLFCHHRREWQCKEPSRILHSDDQFLVCSIVYCPLTTGRI